MYTAISTRNDVKQLAQQIETLAKEVQNKLDLGTDCLAIANELVRNNATFVFALGEFYAVKQLTQKTVVDLRYNSAKSSAVLQRHSHRDSRGRWAKK